jgi:hypothetical protein
VGRAGLLLAVLAVAACSRGAALGDLTYFPGASVTGSTAFIGEAYGFPRAAWEQVELRSGAPYEQVRDFYAGLWVSGWTSTFEHESRKATGRLFMRYLADSRRRTFYVIVVEERQRSRDVGIVLRRGLAR